MSVTLLEQAISLSCKRNNPNNRVLTQSHTKVFYTHTHKHFKAFRVNQPPVGMNMSFIRSLMLKVTFEGKSGCGLTL